MSLSYHSCLPAPFRASSRVRLRLPTAFSERVRRVISFFSLVIHASGKPINTVANFLARQAQFIELLQIEPKFCASAEPVAKTQRRIGRDRPLTIDD